MFYKVSGSVGSGKTQAVLEHIRDHLGVGYLIVSPTVALCNEIYTRTLRTLFEHPEYTNFGALRLVVTEENNREGVFPRALQACRDYNPEVPPIVIVTTKTFEYLMQNLLAIDKGRFEVFIDEGLSPIQQVQFSPGDPEQFLQFFQRDEAGFVTPAPGQREILEWAAYSPNRLNGRQLGHLNVDQFRSICELVVSGNYDVYLVQTERSIEAIGLLSPEPLRSFRSVTLIVAIFERTLLPFVWEQRHGIEFEDFPLQAELFDAHREKGPQISIWYALHEGDLPSKRNLSRNYETGEANERDPRLRVIFQAARAINAHFPDGAYCWTANNDFTNSDDVLEGNRMPALSAGMDEYRRFNSVVSLICINPQPWVKNRMLELLDLEDDQLYELWRFSHTYQAIGRCSVRLRERVAQIEIVVTSRRCAEQLSELFPGSTIEGQITDLPRYSTPNRDEEAIQEFGMAYTKADNSAYSKYRRRREAKGEEPLMKRDWFREIRQPHLAT